MLTFSNRHLTGYALLKGHESAHSKLIISLRSSVSVLQVMAVIQKFWTTVRRLRRLLVAHLYHYLFCNARVSKTLNHCALKVYNITEPK